MSKKPVLFSVLDLCSVREGGTPAQTFKNTVELAQHAERLGFHRYWVAEHHNMVGIASSATAVVIGHIAEHTRTIRVGSGGIMLPNHAPLTIAEQFGTLESMFPGRIDLGLGRAPGGDGAAARALRRGLGSNGDTFPTDLEELIGFFRPAIPRQAVRAAPGEGLHVPLYLLGSSDFSARLAGAIGLPFAFASQFAPDYLNVALDLYRGEFTPSDALDKPHAIVGMNVFAADTDAEAERQFTSLQQRFLNLIRGTPGKVPPPVDSMNGKWAPPEQAHVTRMTRVSAVGGPARVKAMLEALIDETDADELIMTGDLFDQRDRLHSYAIAADAMRQINAARTRDGQFATANG